MGKPSELRSTYCLTGDRNTELVIEAIARACASDGDEWRPVLTAEINVSLMANPGAVPWSEADALLHYKIFLSCVYSDLNARERELQRASEVGPREALLGKTSAGRVLCRTVTDGWAEWKQVGDGLAVQLTTRTLDMIDGR